MGNRYRQPPSDLVRSTLDVTNRVEILERTPRAPQTAVDTGAWKFIADNGVTVVEFGNFSGGRGWEFRRGDTGNLAFALGGYGSTQYWTFRDNLGNDVLSDDAGSQRGLARPWIPYNAFKFSEASAPAITTTSTSFVGAYVVCGIKQHPLVELQYIITTPAGASAELQLVDVSGSTNYVVASVIEPASSNYFSTIRGSVNGVHMTELRMQVELRVASGAGTVGVTLASVYGRQT